MITTSVEIELDGTWQHLGDLRSEFKRGSEFSSFSYSESYLANPHSYPIEPNLPIARGNFAFGKPLPGAFRDAAPDRWGRTLISKWLRGQGQQSAISELQYLTSVSDHTRIGNFRFSGAGQDARNEIEIPPISSLPKLLRLTERIAVDDDLAATKELLEAGSSSLGGARPKSSVVDGDQLWLAKFPHPQDQWDVMGWEGWALSLAKSFGVQTPEFKILRLDGRSVLLLKRFDRIGPKRFGYLSAMSLLGKDDGDSADYLELADAISQSGADVAQQLLELWKRMALSWAIRNTDDHLRNHGFLRVRNGWALSPVFDINPNPEGADPARSTSIAGARSWSSELEMLQEIAPIFGLNHKVALGELVLLRSCLEEHLSESLLPEVHSSEREQFLVVLNQSLTKLHSLVA